MRGAAAVLLSEVRAMKLQDQPWLTRFMLRWYVAAICAVIFAAVLRWLLRMIGTD